MISTESKSDDEKMSNEENIEPSQVKSVLVEENQERICFSTEPALSDHQNLY